MYSGTVERVRYDIGAARHHVDEDDSPVVIDVSRADKCLIIEPHGVGLHRERRRDEVSDLAGDDVSDDQPRGDTEADRGDVEPQDLGAVGGEVRVEPAEALGTDRTRRLVERAVRRDDRSGASG